MSDEEIKRLKQIRRDNRIRADNERLEKLQNRLRTLGERSTFHGIDVLLESRPGMIRRMVLLIVICMCILCVLTVSRLIAGFVNMPISTVINYGKANFHFPIISVCPDSPFSINKLAAYPELKQAYLATADFWISKANQKGDKVFGWQLPENYWRHRVKRTFRGIFFGNRSKFVSKWRDYLVSCEYDGRRCELDDEPIDMPTALMATSEEEEQITPWRPVLTNNTASKRGNSSELGDLPSIWPGKPPDLESMVYKALHWPRGKIVIVDNPTKYYCFQIRLNTTVVKEPGAPRGLHLILRRPYNADTDQPALLTVESRAPMSQAWDDRLFLRDPNSESAKKAAALANAMDGFHVLIHQDAKSPAAGAVTASDIYKSGSSRSIFSVGVRYGQQVSVSVGQFIHKRLSTIYRTCQKTEYIYDYLELSSFLASGGFARRYYKGGYSQSNCVEVHRQKMMIEHCHCVSEDYLVPIKYTAELLRLGFCHSPSPGVKTGSAEFMQRVACHDNISSLPKNIVLDSNIPESYGKPILIKLTNEIQRHWMCPRYCEEEISEAEIVQKQSIPTDLPAEVNGLGKPVKSTDLASISISANSARIRIISEGEQMNVFNLFASIGGIFGLYVGLSGVTLFEIIEALILVLKDLPSLLRIAGRKLKAWWRQRTMS